MNFMGAVQQPFSSFMDLTRSMLDTYCHNWNNLSNPRSYILPPVCSFKNADKSDQDIEIIKNEIEKKKHAGASKESLDSIQRPVIDRYSDSGEFVVFYALWKLIQDEVQAPFFAIQGLDLKNIECYLQQIFPHAQVDIQTKFHKMMREYDFVLIGPKIGLIVIEVKSSHFTKARDFAVTNRHLPDDIIKALNQMDSFDSNFLQLCSGRANTEKIPIRKILFTPNLEKGRFDTWLSKFDNSFRKQIMDKFNGVTHWFSEDMNNKRAQKPPLYTTIREEIGKLGHEIPHEIFESYGLIISGLGTAVVLPSQTNQKTVSTEPDRLSTSIAILKDAAALESQNPKGPQLEETAPNVVGVESKLVLLTPEQQNALNGPNRQFIIGAPGTGKTIIIQAKVAQELMEGKKVLIYAEEPYNEKYEKLFGSHDFCTVRITNQRPIYFPQLIDELKIISEDRALRETLAKLSEHIFGASMVRGDLRGYDSIFIDDAFDEPSSDPDWKTRRIYESISLMAIANSNSKFRSKLVWVACDTFFNDSDEEAYKRILNQIIRGEQGDYFSTTILNRVMRSSESVFQAIYSTEVTQYLAKEPVVGHKIHGFYDSVHLRNLSLDDTLLEIWNHTHNAVKKFKEDGFGYGQMAILIGREQLEFPDLDCYLLDKFRKNGIPVGYNDAVWYVPDFITLDAWRSVSSFEWPVVIYIGMFVSHEKRASAAYNRYRACSRATMKLFEIIADAETD